MLGVAAGVAEGLGEPEGVDEEVDGEMELPGPDGLWPERTISMTTPRIIRAAMTTATGRKVWAPAPPRRAMAASYLSNALYRSAAKQNHTPIVPELKLHPCEFAPTPAPALATGRSPQSCP